MLISTHPIHFPVAYWARVYSLQNAIKLAKQPDEKQFLLQLMDWLENVKKANKDNDLITIETVAQVGSYTKLVYFIEVSRRVSMQNVVLLVFISYYRHHQSYIRLTWKIKLINFSPTLTGKIVLEILTRMS